MPRPKRIPRPWTHLPLLSPHLARPVTQSYTSKGIDVQMAAKLSHDSGTLLGNPLELRLRIFAFCIPDLALEYYGQSDSPPTLVPTTGFFIKPTKDCADEYTRSRCLLCVCRSVRREALPVFRSAFKSLKPAWTQSIIHNPSTMVTANLHRDVNESIQTFGFRDHLKHLPDYTEFPNLKTLELNIHQGGVSQSYHTMDDDRRLDFVSAWLNIRSWQNSILWELIFNQEDKALLVNVVASVARIDNSPFIEVSSAYIQCAQKADATYL